MTRRLLALLALASTLAACDVGPVDVQGALSCLGLCEDGWACVEGVCAPACEVDEQCPTGCCAETVDKGLRCAPAEVCQ